MQPRVLELLKSLQKRILQAFCCCSPRLGGYSPLDPSLGPADEARTLLSARASIASETQLANGQYLSALSSSEASGERPQLLVIMRHGHRQDELEVGWTETADRPWDPPLSDNGRLQARDAGFSMRELGIERVITSPFLRCLQTSAEVVSILELGQGHWAVDWSLGEICDPRVLFGGRKELVDKFGRRDVDTWMWDGQQMEERLSDFAYEEAVRSEVLFPPLDVSALLPAYPETIHQGLRRYGKAFQGIVSRSKGKSTLLVTHGEALRKAVEMFAPGSEVYEVQHTGYVVLQCTAAGSSDLSDWKLVSQPGETGVQWFEL